MKNDWESIEKLNPATLNVDHTSLDSVYNQLLQMIKVFCCLAK